MPSRSILGDIDSADFIARYWQREPLLVRGALGIVGSPVDGDTLAGLACEPEIDARLVLSDPRCGAWTCEQGPFDEARFSTLPPTHWTLLVQSVDHWLQEVAALRDHFGFLPRWRLDDVMVSYASEGGGVGPHFDQYDVFLLQLGGTRRWQVGQRCDAHTPLQAHPDLKLLPGIETRAEWVLEPGDMLYLPPGVAHEGTAVNEACITASIGFRAPSQGEILQGAMDQMVEQLTDDLRFRDSPGSMDADPYLINAQVLERLTALWPGGGDADVAQALGMAFGQLVSEPRNPDLVEPGSQAAVDAVPSELPGGEGVSLTHHRASRFAWQRRGSRALLYVDGGCHETTPAVARGICHGHLSASDLDAASARLLETLLREGSLTAAVQVRSR